MQEKNRKLQRRLKKAESYGVTPDCYKALMLETPFTDV